jgi:DNA-directed RNA polymerase subunit E'/Rpb7
MEPYFEKSIFQENVVVHPKYLTPNLIENLRCIITKNYPKIYKHKGYIFDVKIVTILDNRISLFGQIVYIVKFEANLFVPRVGQTFYNLEIKNTGMSKYRWVEIRPFKIFLQFDVIDDESQPIDVEITNVKSDLSIIFGKIV